MKKQLIFLFCLFVSGNLYPQSSNADLANRMLRKAENLRIEIQRELDRQSRLAMNSSNKDIYVLYQNGRKMGCFANEWTCKAQINSIKLQMESLIETFLSELPRSVSSSDKVQVRNYVKTQINASINYTYRKEANLNYRESGLAGKNNGFNSNSDIFSQETSDKPVTTSIFSSQNDTKTSQNNVLESLAVSSQKSDNSQKSLYDLLAIEASSTKKEDGQVGYSGKFPEIGASVNMDRSLLVQNTENDYSGSLNANIAYKGQYTEEDRYGAKMAQREEESDEQLYNALKKLRDMDEQKGNYWQSNTISIDGIVKFADNTFANEWNMIYSSIDNPQRFATIIGFMSEANGGEMPELIQVGGNYWFAGKNGSIFIISKDGSTISYGDQKGQGAGHSEKLTFGSGHGDVSYNSNNQNVTASSSKAYGVKNDVQKQEVKNKTEVGVSGSIEAHYNLVSGNTLELSINENGAITGWGTGLAVGPSASLKAGTNLEGEFGVGGGVSLGKAEVKAVGVVCPVMNIKEDGSVNFRQAGLEVSGEGGLGLNAELGKKIKALGVGLGFDIYNPDINTAVKQLPKDTALKMVAGFANNSDAVSTDKKVSNQGYNPYSGVFYYYTNDSKVIEQFLANLPNETKK